VNDVHDSQCGCLPLTMRSSRFHGKRSKLTVESVPVPEIGEGEALVRVVASGVCRSDWHLWNGDWGWLGMELSEGATLGHEIGGTIVKIGPGVKRVTPGMDVTIPCFLACGYCQYCLQGLQNLCDNGVPPMLLEGAGGWQEYVKIPTADLNCIPLPAGVDALTAAALGCRYMTAWRAVADRANVRGGEFVVVHGCGGVGLAAIQISAALGGRTIAVDIDDQKLAKAKEAGAIATINARGLDPMQVGEAVKLVADGTGVEIAIDALGGSRTTLAGIYSLRKSGRLVQVGLSGGDDKGMIGVPLDYLTVQELSIVGSVANPHSAYPRLLGLVASGKLNPKSLVSHEIGLDEIEGVLEDMDQFKTSGYVIITKF